MHDIKESDKVRGKFIIEFDPDDGTQVDELKKLLSGRDWSLVAWDLDQKFRSILKYECDGFSEETINKLQEMRDYLHECMGDRGLDFENDM